MVKKAVCLVSGGIDSCVVSAIAKKQGYEIYALTFNYGQTHKKEIECAKKICTVLKVKKHIILDIDLKQFGGSSLTDSSLKIPEVDDIKKIGKNIPSTYVPGRNTIFLSFALAYAEVIDAATIFIGVNALDYSGYRDCRPKYVKAFQKMANLATKRGAEGKNIGIRTPLINLTKADIIKRGIEIDAPLKRTWSCYMGKQRACGRCESCLLRLKGFKEAGFKDPIEYEFLPDWYKN